MKKILSLVLVLAMIMSCTIFASAAVIGGDGSEGNPWILDTVPCEIEGTFEAKHFDFEGVANHFYDVTMTESGTITLDSWSGCSVAFMVNGEWGYFDPLTVVAGDVVTVNAFGYAEGSYSISLGFTAGSSSEGGEGGEGGDVEQEIYEGGELALGENTLGVNAGENYSPNYTFIPEEDGYLTLDMLTLAVTGRDGIVTEFTPDEIVELVEGYYFGLLVDGFDYYEPIPVTAGTEYVISLYQSRMHSVNGCSCEATVYLSMGESEPEPIYEGEFDVETTDTYCYNELCSFVAPVTGTYEFFIPAGLGILTEEAYLNWGSPIIDYYENEGGYTFTLDMQEGDVFSFYTGSIIMSTWTISYVVYEGGEGGEGGEGSEGTIPDGAVDLTIGNNNINGANIDFIFTAPSAGNLVLNLGVSIMGNVSAEVTVNFGNAQTLNTMGQISLDLAAGDVVLVSFTASGYATMTAEWDGEGGEGGGEEPGPEPGYDPDGTEAYPYIIEELPYEGTQPETDDLFYQWTATADGILYLYTEGLCSMVGSSISGWEAIDGGKYIAVAAGDVIILNIWNATSFTVTFDAGGEAPEPEPEYMLGDANGDDQINYLDAMLIAQFYVGDITEDELNFAACDVNSDGSVNYLDAMLIAQYYVGDIESFE